MLKNNGFDNLDLTNYLEFARSTAVYPNIGNNWQYTLIGAVGELGELSNILKKTLRDYNEVITQERQEKLRDELGDLFWYLVMLCYELGFNPDMILELNRIKLLDRKKNNTIHGKGLIKELPICQVCLKYILDTEENIESYSGEFGIGLSHKKCARGRN